nr:hypothetical protein [Tanacetum cinerariifolium]
MNLTTALHEKKKSSHLLILSVRFTKLIIHHLKTKHNIHPRIGSPLHYSHEEYVLNTLMFVGKYGREIFCMPIPDALLTDAIKGAPFYSGYLEHVTEYQRYLDAEHSKVEEEVLPKYPKATKVTKPTKDKASKPTSSQPPKPKPAPSKPSKAFQENKQKLVKETPMSNESSRNVESPSIDAELTITDSVTESNEEVAEINIGDRDESQARPNPGEHGEGQANQTLVVLQSSTPDINSNNHSSHNNNNSSTTTTSTTIKYPLEERLDKHGSHLYNLENPNIPYQVSKAVDEIVTDAVDWAMQALLRAHFNYLSAVDMKEILHQRMFTDKSYKAHEDHKNLFDTLQKSLERDYSNQLLSDIEEACQKKRKRRELPTTPFGPPPSQPPPPPPPAGTSGAQGLQAHPRLRPQRHNPWLRLHLTLNMSQLFQMEECHKLFTDQIEWMNPGGDQVKINVSRPLPLGGPPSHVIIQTQFFFKKDLEYFWYGNKGSSPTLSISKMKTACYPYFGLKLLVSKQLWIDDVCTYDISAKYVVFPAKNNARKIMRFNKIYKFSDGTLTRIMEALDYKVKEFKIKQLNL